MSSGLTNRILKASKKRGRDPFAYFGEFQRGGVVDLDPIDLEEHKKLYGSINRFLGASDNIRDAVSVFLINLFLSTNKDFYAPGSNDYAASSRGRNHMKKQLDAFLGSVRALQVLANPGPNVGNFKGPENLGYIIRDMVSLYGNPEWNGKGSYELVYLQVPELDNEETREHYASEGLVRRVLHMYDMHSKPLYESPKARKDVSDAAIEEMFAHDSLLEVYENCKRHISEHPELSDSSLFFLNMLKSSIGFAASIEQGRDCGEGTFEDQLPKEMAALVSEEQYVDILSKNVAKTGGVLILESAQLEDDPEFEHVQSFGDVHMYQRIVE